MSTLYAGPGKVYRAADTTVCGAATSAAAAKSFQPDGENGPIKVVLNETTSEVATAMFGFNSEQLEDQTVDVTFKPFDNWLSLTQLFPPWLGIDTSAIADGAAGPLSVGGRPHGLSTAHVPTTVYTPDGRLYAMVRTAMIGHPSLHLGVGKALYGDAKIIGIGDETKALGASGFLFSGNAITESSGSDPQATAMTTADFMRESWTGSWGSVTGFTTMQAEDEWTIEVKTKYSPLKVQGRTYTMKLDAVSVMAKLRPYGPTHTQLIGAIGAHTSGQRLGQHDLTLTSAIAGRTIILKNTEVKGAGFDFGGTKLGTGEVGFVIQQTFASGVPGAYMIFSA